MIVIIIYKHIEMYICVIFIVFQSLVFPFVLRKTLKEDIIIINHISVCFLSGKRRSQGQVRSSYE